jgi:hypothetical protein
VANVADFNCGQTNAASLWQMVSVPLKVQPPIPLHLLHQLLLI